MLGQSHKDNVHCTAVDEQLRQLEAKEVQLSQPSSTSLLMISSGLLHMNTQVGRFCTRFKESVLQPRPEGGQLVRRDSYRISHTDLIVKVQVIMEVVTHR